MVSICIVSMCTVCGVCVCGMCVLCMHVVWMCGVCMYVYVWYDVWCYLCVVYFLNSISFGCAWAIPGCCEWGLLSGCGVRAPHCGGLSGREGQALEHRLSSCGSRV